MKLIGMIPAYNEELFLDYAISSVHDFVDELIIVDIGMKDSLEIGLGHRSTDKTPEIIDKWLKKSTKCHLILSEKEPKTHGESLTPAVEMAKKMGGDWLFLCGADEIWPKAALSPMKNFLGKCDKNNILGLNVWMNYFAPDFWHFKDFRNPRISKLTPDAVLTEGGAGMFYPDKNIWIYAGGINEPRPPNTPEYVLKANFDYPKMLRPFHYSCVGYDRIKAKYEFYKNFENSVAEEFYAHYMNKNWAFFEQNKYRDFTGRHPEMMKTHKCYTEHLY